MTSIPGNLSRVPNLLMSRLSLSAISRGSVELAKLQTQLATNKAINRPSDDAVRAATISLLNERLERAGQLARNLQHADAALSVADQALADASDLALEAKQIASAQVNTTSTAGEREAQAAVVDSLIQALYSITGRTSVAGHIFGGSNPGQRPVVEFAGGYRYLAGGPGLTTDLGTQAEIPITLGASPLGQTSARLNGLVDLAPDLTPEARIHDLRGARSLGVTLGTVMLSIDGGEGIAIDLSQADTVQDVLDAVTGAIGQHEAAESVSVLGPGAVSVSGGGISIDVLAGHTLTFTDAGDGSAALDLGLADADGALQFSDVSPTGEDLRPRLTWLTSLEAVGALTLPLGAIEVTNAGRSSVIDLSGAETMQDIRRLIEGANLGLRVELADDRLVVVNEVAAGRAGAMSIAEIAGNGSTASMLGIRSLDLGTRIADFNDGRGVQIISGATDPVSGLPSGTLDVDFRITLGNGIEIDIDLQPAHMTTVESFLQAVNDQAATQLTALGQPTTLFSAGLAADGNGIVLSQDGSISAPLTVEARNGSHAAEQLGLLGGTWDASSASLISEDRAKVRVDSLFTALIDLRDALRSDDPLGITLAGERIDAAADLLAEVRGLTGEYARRVERETKYLEDRELLDTTVRSQLQDLDFAAAASRFTLLQTQIEAGYQSAAALSRLTLLDFLG